MSQVSERIVLSQKAYILFYIKNPTNGHAVPAELAQHAQQLSKSLNSLQAAAVKGDGSPAEGPTASHSKHPAPPPVFGPAPRLAIGLLAAKQLHNELLAPTAQATHMLKAKSKQRADTQAAGTDTGATSGAAAGTDQQPISSGKSSAVISDSSASHQQGDAQAQAQATADALKPSAKRKADVLTGSGKRPSMMQKMSAAGIDATVNTESNVEASKRMKLSTDHAAAAATAADKVPAVEESSVSAVPSDGLARRVASSVQGLDDAEPPAHEHVDTKSSQERHAGGGAVGSSRFVITVLIDCSVMAVLFWVLCSVDCTCHTPAD